MFEKDTDTRWKISGQGDNPAPAQNVASVFLEGITVLIRQATKPVFDRITVESTSLQKQLSQLETTQQAIRDHVDTRFVSLDAQLGKVLTGQQQLTYYLERIEKLLEQVRAENKLLEDISRENHLLGEQHYRQHIVEPMVRSLFPVFDFVEDARNAAFEHNLQDAALEKLIDGILIQLEQFLSAYEIEPVRHKPRAKFDPSMMRPVKTFYTGENELDGRVAKSLQTGFRWGFEKLLRPESVAIYKYKEQQVNIVNKQENERGRL